MNINSQGRFGFGFPSFDGHYQSAMPRHLSNMAQPIGNRFYPPNNKSILSNVNNLMTSLMQQLQGSVGTNQWSSKPEWPPTITLPPPKPKPEEIPFNLRFEPPVGLPPVRLPVDVLGLGDERRRREIGLLPDGTFIKPPVGEIVELDLPPSPPVVPGLLPDGTFIKPEPLVKIDSPAPWGTGMWGTGEPPLTPEEIRLRKLMGIPPGSSRVVHQ